MKKHKKNILIIAVIFFVLLGLSGGVRTFATNEDGDSWQWSSHDREDDTDDNEDHTEIDPAGGGGTTGGTTDPGTGNNNQNQETKKSASSSIVVKVIKSEKKEAKCSIEEAYKCLVGESEDKKKDEKDNEDGTYTHTYTWTCKEGNSQDQCKFEETKNKNPDDNGTDGICRYIEDYYPTISSTDPRKIYLCGNGEEAESTKYDESDGYFKWNCPGSDGGKTVKCEKKKYIKGLCGKEDLTCLLGEVLDYRNNEDGDLIGWTCIGPFGPSPEINFDAKSEECYPRYDGICSNSPFQCSSGSVKSEKTEGNFFSWDCVGEKTTEHCNYEEIIPDPVNGICGNEPYRCLSNGQSKNNTEKEDGYSWVCSGQYGGEDTSCFQEKPKKDGQCGSAHGAFYSITPKDKDLCSSGQIIGPIKIGDRAWSWQCAGSNGGKTASCQTFSVSLSPKISGCYIKEGESVCQPEKEYSWIASGIDSILSLITNMSVFELDSNSGSRSLSVRYPMSDIFLKKGEEELAHSRAWAVCENGLYWDKENNKCVAPIECPKPPEEDKEGKTDKTIPYWKKGGAPVCQKDSNGTYFAVYEETCEGYDEGKNLFCRDENGAENKGEIRETELPCYQNRKQTATISVTLKAERDGSNLEITESNGTEYPFYLKWKAFATKENGEPELVTCKDIKLTEGGGVLYDKTISTDGRSSGTSKVKNPGIKKDTLKYEITCSSYSGAKGTGTVKVYLEKRDGEISET